MKWDLNYKSCVGIFNKVPNYILMISLACRWLSSYRGTLGIYVDYVSESWFPISAPVCPSCGITRLQLSDTNKISFSFMVLDPRLLSNTKSSFSTLLKPFHIFIKIKPFSYLKQILNIITFLLIYIFFNK